jgi:NitT/TauT family transport system permease protein
LATRRRLTRERSGLRSPVEAHYACGRGAKPGGWQRLASILLFLGLWQLSATLAESWLLPDRRRSCTLARVGIGFAIAMAVGVALGIALGRLQWLDRWLHPWMVILLNVPALVIIILSYVRLDLVSGGDDDAA